MQRVPFVCAMRVLWAAPSAAVIHFDFPFPMGGTGGRDYDRSSRIRALDAASRGRASNARKIPREDNHAVIYTREIRTRRYPEIERRLADPRGLSDADADALVKEAGSSCPSLKHPLDEDRRVQWHGWAPRSHAEDAERRASRQRRGISPVSEPDGPSWRRVYREELGTKWRGADALALNTVGHDNTALVLAPQRSGERAGHVPRLVPRSLSEPHGLHRARESSSRHMPNDNKKSTLSLARLTSSAPHGTAIEAGKRSDLRNNRSTSMPGETNTGCGRTCRGLRRGPSCVRDARYSTAGRDRRRRRAHRIRVQTNFPKPLAGRMVRLRDTSLRAVAGPMRSSNVADRRRTFCETCCPLANGDSRTPPRETIGSARTRTDPGRVHSRGDERHNVEVVTSGNGDSGSRSRSVGSS